MGIYLDLNDPVITSRSDHAFTLSILPNTQMQNWFLSSTLQLFGSTNTQVLDFFQIHNLKKLSTPFYTVLRIEHTSSANIDKIIIDALKQNSYVRLYLDQYYLQYRNGYFRSHKTNDTLIYGFNEDTNLFHYLAVNKNGLFEKKVIAPHHLKNALAFANSNEAQRKKIYFYQLNQSPPLELDSIQEQIKIYLEDYVGCYDSFSRFGVVNNDSLVFGMKVYQLLHDHLTSVNKMEKELEITNFQVLIEHKLALLQAVQLLASLTEVPKDLLSVLKEVHHNAVVLKSSVLRYMWVKEEKSYLKLNMKLLEIKEMEKTAIIGLLDSMS
jgi:hypothetical protein